jgi:hypothetical protein
LTTGRPPDTQDGADEVPKGTTARLPKTTPLIVAIVIASAVVLLVAVQLILGSQARSTARVPDSGEPNATLVSPSSTSVASVPSVSPVPSAPTAAPTGDTASTPAGTATLLPVKASARDIGQAIRMAPGPDGGLYVSIPTNDGQVVALLGANGQPRSGWPVRLRGVNNCDHLLPLDDDTWRDDVGTVRVVCTVPPSDDGLASTVRRAFAFAPTGKALPGWPVDIDDAFTARTIGATLVMIVLPYEGDAPPDGAPTHAHIVSVDNTGKAVHGPNVDIPCGQCDWALSPEAIAFVTIHRDWSPTNLAVVKTDVFAFDQTGMRPGWPITIDGNGSAIAFDRAGLAYLVVGSPLAAPSRLVVINRDSRINGSEDQSFASTSTWDGAGGETPGAPVVGGDGTAYIISTAGGATAAVGFENAGDRFLIYESPRPMQWTGYCAPPDTGCGYERTAPAVGPGKILYLLQGAAKESGGGRIIAVNSAGQVVPGWPVDLRRAGGMFWSVVANPRGGAWALAIEPENSGFSATVLGIAGDSSVQYATTIVEP